MESPFINTILSSSTRARSRSSPAGGKSKTDAATRVLSGHLAVGVRGRGKNAGRECAGAKGLQRLESAERVRT